jgi:DNA-binding transcriptional LysR family regulator
MRFTLRPLQVFVAVAQQESVSRAAGLLNLSQSAASTSITELERQSSCQLFDRAGKRLSLNALGKQLLPQAVACSIRPRKSKTCSTANPVSALYQWGRR